MSDDKRLFLCGPPEGLRTAAGVSASSREEDERLRRMLVTFSTVPGTEVSKLVQTNVFSSRFRTKLDRPSNGTLLAEAQTRLSRKNETEHEFPSRSFVGRRYRTAVLRDCHLKHTRTVDRRDTGILYRRLLEKEGTKLAPELEVRRPAEQQKAVFAGEDGFTGQPLPYELSVVRKAVWRCFLPACGVFARVTLWLKEKENSKQHAGLGCQGKK